MASITEIQKMLEENQKSFLSEMQNKQALMDNSISVLTEKMTDIQKNVESKLRTLEEDVQSITPYAPPKTPKKKPTRSKVKQEPSTFFRPAKLNNLSDENESDASVHSNISGLSTLSNEEDIRIINQLSKPTFRNEDAKMKQQLDELKRIQEKYFKRIPKLAYTSSDSSEDTPPTHNYGVWIDALMKYYFVLSPSMASTIKKFLQTVDVDNLLIDGSQLNIPNVTEDSLFIRFATMSAITDTVSTDFVELVQEDDNTNVFENVFASLVNILVFCAPNSQEDRVENMSEFFTQTQGSYQNDESITKFAKRVVDLSRKINDQYSTPQISQEQVYSTIINGIRKGSQKEAYASALDTLKFNVKSSRAVNIQSTVLWLHRKCDKNKLRTAQSASLANHRGGRGGRGRGRGRGGKGGRNSSESKNDNESKNQQPIPIAEGSGTGSITWKDNYYAVQDTDGTDKVAKEIQEKKSKQPCFKLITDKVCSNYNKGTCPYNHEFNIIDTRKNSSSNSQQSNSEQKKLPPSAPTLDASAASTLNFNSNNTQQHSDSSDDGSDSSAFDYSYSLGFSHKASAATVSNTYSRSYVCNGLLSVLSTLTSTDLLYDCLQLMFTVWFVLFSLPHIFFSSISFCSSLFAVCGKVMESSLIFSEVILSEVILSQPIEIADFSTHLHFLSDLNFSLLFFILFGVIVAYIRITGKSFKHFVFGVYAKQALYKIILDCGCTFTMSGDFGLFIKSSLTPVHEEVGLAESGKASVATHKGKIVIDGRVIDSLYVPDFKQTMVSMGQLERMGLSYTKTAHNVRSFLTDKGDTFLSFFVAPNNLYPLLPRDHSTSAGKTSQDSS